ncbi:hypothetical protein M0R72_07685 [Candidatus Pacearchaeota archaeon]|jgi:hypothetical protein|nr:hypothetical protein [Candidatus Pacearchaeota archaeon]
MPRIQDLKRVQRKPTTTKQKAGKARGKAKHALKAPRKALGALQSPSEPLPTPQAEATPMGKPKLVPLEDPSLGRRFLDLGLSKTFKEVFAEPPKSELELLIEAVNRNHMDTLRLGKAFIASAIETGTALAKAAKKSVDQGWELRGTTAVSEVDKSVYRRVNLAKTDRFANLVSPTSRANLREILRAMQDLELRTPDGE